jgi:hypothetical protein
VQDAAREGDVQLEAVPQQARFALRNGADGLPLCLQRAERFGRLDPVGGVGERFGALAELRLLLEILGALAGLLREELGAARADGVDPRAGDDLGTEARGNEPRANDGVDGHMSSLLRSASHSSLLRRQEPRVVDVGIRGK